MSSLLSFPNFLCILLTGALVVHLACRDHTEGSLPDTTDRIEDLYCRLPQSDRLEDSPHCSSAQKLFLLLGNDCSLDLKRKKPEEVFRNVTETTSITEEVEEHSEVVTVEVTEDMEVEANKEPEEEEVKSSLVDSFVISLLVCSAVVSLLEWYREKARDKRQVSSTSFYSVYYIIT